MKSAADKVGFTGSLGETLAARLDLPAGPPRAFALFAHCFSCSKDFYAAARIAKQLVEHGIAVLRFDFTGLGHSDGDFANTNFSSNVEDLVAAANFLRESHEAPHLLIGHSLGGAAVLMAAHKVPECTAVVTIGSPADPEHVLHNFAEHVHVIEEKGEAEVELAGRPFTIKKQFLDDLRSSKVLDSVTSLKKALLVCHAPLDSYVAIDNATQIFSSAKHPKSFVSLDDADHLLTKKEDAAYVGGVIASWSSRYLIKAERRNLPKAAEGEVIVQETGEGKFANVIVSGEHVFFADEPVSVGGNDSGPGPYDLLSASLGACTTMTLRLYAEHKGLPLDRVTVSLRHDKRHAEDSEDCKGKIDHIDKEITIEGDLTEEQRQRMLEISERCPVHRTLNSPVIIDTKLRD